MYISIDIGGTNTRVAASENLKDILAATTFSSVHDFLKQKENIKSAIREVTNNKKVTAYCIGIAGLIDVKKRIVIRSPNYPELNNISIAELVDEHDKNIVFCQNDTKIAALGEAVLGAGIDFTRVGYLSIGTGLGGAVVTNKKLDDVTYEPGHQVVNFDDPTLKDGFGLSGVLETYLAGPKFEQRYGRKADNKVPDEVWFDYGQKLGLGIQNVIFMWNPECIVIGGGMSTHYAKFLPGLEAYLKKLTFVQVPPIKKAKFDQGSGIVGGLVYLSEVTR